MMVNGKSERERKEDNLSNNTFSTVKENSKKRNTWKITTILSGIFPDTPWAILNKYST